MVMYCELEAPVEDELGAGLLLTNFQFPSPSTTRGLLGLMGYLEGKLLAILVELGVDKLLVLLDRILLLLLLLLALLETGVGIVRLGILKVFIQSKTCSLLDDFLSGIKGMTESEVGNLLSLGIAYLLPLLNRILLFVLFTCLY